MARVTELGTGPSFDPSNPTQVQALAERSRGLPLNAAHVDQASLAKQRAEIASEEAAKAAKRGQPVPRRDGAGKAFESGAAPMGNSGADAGRTRVELEGNVGHRSVNFVPDEVSKSQPSTRGMARDYRIAQVQCAHCDSNFRQQQKLPLDGGDWAPDLATSLYGPPASHMQIKLPRDPSVIGFGGGGFGWYVDAEAKRWFCSRGCLERRVIAERQHGGKPVLSGVERINDASYAARHYASPVERKPAPLLEQTTPSRPMLAIGAAAAPAPVSTPVAAAPGPATPAPAPATPAAQVAPVVDLYASPVAPATAAPRGRIARDPNAPKPQRGGRRSTTAPKTTAAPVAPAADPIPES